MTKIRPKEWVILQWRRAHHWGDLLSANTPVWRHGNQCGCMATTEDSLWQSIPKRSLTTRAVTSRVLNNIWTIQNQRSSSLKKCQSLIYECLLCMCPHSCAPELSMQLHSYMFLVMVHYWVSLELMSWTRISWKRKMFKCESLEGEAERRTY